MIVEAVDLGLRASRGWVFRNVNLQLDAGRLLALTGRPGSGRTSLLLALAGHFKTNAGRLTRNGPAALGYIPGLQGPEPALTVAEHIEERLLLIGRWSRRRRREQIETTIAAASALAGEPLHPDAKGRELTSLQRQELGLALAALNEPRLIVTDDVDAGMDSDERRRLWLGLADLAAQGYAVVAAAREAEPGIDADRYELTPPEPEWRETSRVDEPTAPENDTRTDSPQADRAAVAGAEEKS